MSFIYEKPVAPALPTFGGGQATFDEVWRSSRDLAIFADNFNAEEQALEEAYDRRIDRIMTATGAALKNPMRQPTAAPRAAGIRIGELKTREQWMADFDRHVSLLIKQHPEARDAISPGMPVKEVAKAIAREAEARFGREVSSRQDFFGKWTAALGGGMAGSLRDPVQVGTLMAGGGPGAARTVAGRLLTVMVKEMAINGAVEAAMQPKVQSWREKAGLEAGFLQGVRNTIFAGAIGGLFGFGGQIVAEGASRLFKGRLLDEAASAAADGLDPASPVAKSLKGAPAESATDLEAIREALPPEGRGALDARAAERPGDETRQADAIAFAEDPRESRLGDLRQELLGEMGPRPTGRHPASLLTFLARLGGLAEHGDLAALGADRWFGPGGRLVRKEGGLSLDEARRRAVEAGYLKDTEFEGGVATSTTDDLTDAIASEIEGRKVYSREDGDAEELARLQRQHDDSVALIDKVIGGLDGVMSDDLPLPIKRRAADIMIADAKTDAETALERAIMEDYYSGEPERALTYDDGTDIPFATDDGAGSTGQRADAARPGGGPDGRTERGDAPDGAEPRDFGEAQSRPAEPAGGVDDPLSPEEVKLTEDMLKELDPDGALADALPEAKALKDEMDELSELGKFLTHCKVGA